MGDVTKFPTKRMDFGLAVLAQIAAIGLAALWLRSRGARIPGGATARRAISHFANCLGRLHDALTLIEQSAPWLLRKLKPSDFAVLRTDWVTAVARKRGETLFIDHLDVKGLDQALTRMEQLQGPAEQDGSAIQS
jgi:hypothetical protein